ncbi:MAG: hypothetical protein SFU85_11410 [Candidatus Methylacidiphilales bacterium]|nr:hypothetical protein [Candidatus Methylacidiphilales bacterium]
MLFGSKESPTPVRPLVGGTQSLRGQMTLLRDGGFEADLNGQLRALQSVHLLPGAVVWGGVSAAGEIVLHEGSQVRGPIEAGALDLQEGAIYSGMVRIGPDSTP